MLLKALNAMDVLNGWLNRLVSGLGSIAISKGEIERTLFGMFPEVSRAKFRVVEDDREYFSSFEITLNTPLLLLNRFKDVLRRFMVRSKTLFYKWAFICLAGSFQHQRIYVSIPFISGCT